MSASTIKPALHSIGNCYEAIRLLTDGKKFADIQPKLRVLKSSYLNWLDCVHGARMVASKLAPLEVSSEITDFEIWLDSLNIRDLPAS